MPDLCTHPEFAAHVEVTRILDLVPETCAKCGGMGEIITDTYSPTTGHGNEKHDCPVCKGTGQVLPATLPPDAVPKSFLADVTVRCSACDTPFKFLGLSSGLDYRGAKVSWDGTKAHLALWPGNTPLTPPAPNELRGFNITGPSPDAVDELRRAVLRAEITPCPGEPTLLEQAAYLRNEAASLGPALPSKARARFLQIADYLGSLALKVGPA